VATQAPPDAASVQVIEPSHGWAGLRLRELWRYRELVLFFTWRNVLVRYKQTVLGIAWAVLQPLLLMVLMTLFFGSYAKRAGVPGPVFYLAALVPWMVFSSSVSQSSNSLVANANLLSKVYFPRLTAPLAAVLATLVDFLAAFAVLLVFVFAYGVTPRPSAVVLVPALLALAVVSALGVGLWLSALNVVYRDVQYVVPFLIQVGLFASIFAGSVHREPLRTILSLNPMAGVVEGFRYAVVGADTAPGRMVAISVGVALAVLVSGAYYFRRTERTFADVV
jgi:lipopolysaccharide transport system permease protein